MRVSKFRAYEQKSDIRLWRGRGRCCVLTQQADVAKAVNLGAMERKKCTLPRETLWTFSICAS